MSRQSYCCLKTKEWRQCWCTKPICYFYANIAFYYSKPVWVFAMWVKTLRKKFKVRIKASLWPQRMFSLPDPPTLRFWNKECPSSTTSPFPSVPFFELGRTKCPHPLLRTTAQTGLPESLFSFCNQSFITVFLFVCLFVCLFFSVELKSWIIPRSHVPTPGILSPSQKTRFTRFSSEWTTCTTLPRGTACRSV